MVTDNTQYRFDECRQDLLTLTQYLSANEFDAIEAVFDNEEIELTKPPSCGFIMMTVKDAFNTDFHLGEVLVTTAEVIIEGEAGHGTVLGDNPRGAVVAATAEGILRNPESRYRDALRRVIADIEEKHRQRRQKEEGLVAASKVSFEEMVEG